MQNQNILKFCVWICVARENYVKLKSNLFHKKKLKSNLFFLVSLSDVQHKNHVLKLFGVNIHKT
jgi:hypothetical protein